MCRCKGEKVKFKILGGTLFPFVYNSFKFIFTTKKTETKINYFQSSGVISNKNLYFDTDLLFYNYMGKAFYLNWNLLLYLFILKVTSCV